MAKSPAHAIRLLVLDVDGVLTDGQILLDYRGRELKSFHVRDGQGLRLWMSLGYQAAIITGRSSLVVANRAAELGIGYVLQGVQDKSAALDTVLEQTGIEPLATACIGDDLPDLPLFRRVGYPVAVADADSHVKAAARYVTTRSGGHGAVREVIEHLLTAQNRWTDAISQFGIP